MANCEDLRPGDEVWIKEPTHIYGKVVGPRPGDATLPRDKQAWMVQILPRIQYLPPDRFELVDRPKDPNAPHDYPSKEWFDELAASYDSGTRWLANNSDTKAMNEFVESLRKLGFITPK